MTIFRAGNFRFGWLLATALALSISPVAGQTYTPEQEQACTGDAFRLCSAEIPDVGLAPLRTAHRLRRLCMQSRAVDIAVMQVVSGTGP